MFHLRNFILHWLDKRLAGSRLLSFRSFVEQRTNGARDYATLQTPQDDQWNSASRFACEYMFCLFSMVLALDCLPLGTEKNHVRRFNFLPG